MGKKTRRHLTEKQIQLLEDWCKNAQDAVIIRTLYEGVTVQELIQLREDDVDPATNTLILTTGADADSDVRHLRVSDRCIELVGQAAQQKMYLASNGLLDGEQSIEVYLAVNDHVVRTTMGIATEKVIQNRIHAIARQYPYEPKISIELLIESGRIRAV